MKQLKKYSPRPSGKKSRDQAKISRNIDFGGSAQHVLLLGLVIVKDGLLIASATISEDDAL
eukprot:1493163-Pleurochrysis_carterae.AAC.1